MFDTFLIIRQYFCWYQKCVCSWANGTSWEWFGVVFTLRHTHTFINIGIDIKYWHISHTKLLIKRTIKWMILHKKNMNPAPMLVFGCNLDGFETFPCFFEFILWRTLIIHADIWVVVWPIVIRLLQPFPLFKLLRSHQSSLSESSPSHGSFSLLPRYTHQTFSPHKSVCLYVCLSVFRQLLGLLDQTH